MSKQAEILSEIAHLMTWELRKAFPDLGAADIAAIGGNGAHESAGFRILQEIKPTVAGSRGGWGYFQWTGPRRRAFEAWTVKRGLDPSGAAANIGFLVFELQTSEKAALPALRRAKGLEAKVKAFEMAYERAGVKHYPSRLEWARKFLAAMPKLDAELLDCEALKKPPKPLTQSKTVWGAVSGWLSGAGATLLAAVNGMDWKVVAVLCLAGLAAFVIIRERMAKE